MLFRSLFGAFCPFHLGGRQPACVSKAKNHSKIHRCQVRSSFAGAEAYPNKESSAENTCRIAKELDTVWVHLRPSKPCLTLLIDGMNKKYHKPQKTSISICFEQLAKIDAFLRTFFGNYPLEMTNYICYNNLIKRLTIYIFCRNLYKERYNP